MTTLLFQLCVCVCVCVRVCVIVSKAAAFNVRKIVGFEWLIKGAVKLWARVGPTGGGGPGRVQDGWLTVEGVDIIVEKHPLMVRRAHRSQSTTMPELLEETEADLGSMRSEPV